MADPVVDGGYPKRCELFGPVVAGGAIDIIRDRYGKFWIPASFRTSGSYNYPYVFRIDSDLTTLLDTYALPLGALIPDPLQGGCLATSASFDDDGDLHVVGVYDDAGGYSHICYWFKEVGSETFDDPVQVDIGNPSGQNYDQGYNASGNLSITCNNSNELLVAWSGTGWNTTYPAYQRPAARIRYKSGGSWTWTSCVMGQASALATHQYWPQANSQWASDGFDNRWRVAVYEDRTGFVDLVHEFRIIRSGGTPNWTLSNTRNTSYGHTGYNSRMLQHMIGVGGDSNFRHVHINNGTKDVLYQKFGSISDFTVDVEGHPRGHATHNKSPQEALVVFYDLVDAQQQMRRCDDLPNSENGANWTNSVTITGWPSATNANSRPTCLLWPVINSKRFGIPTAGFMFMKSTLATISGDLTLVSDVWAVDGLVFPLPDSLVSEPLVFSIDPDSGPTTGGTSVTISGSDFQDGVTVTFGGSSATGVSVSSDGTEITCLTSTHAAGAVDVVITNPDAGTVTETNGFTYADPPSIVSLTPSSGPVEGGTSVTITGTDFQSGATVTFGGSSATGVSVSSDGTEITCTTPAHAAGAVDVVVINLDALSDTLSSGFTYYATEDIISISPWRGSTEGSTLVTITVSSSVGLMDGATVTFDGLAATSVSVDSAGDSLTCLTPAHAAGAVAVVVTNPAPDLSQFSLSNGYFYVLGLPQYDVVPQYPYREQVEFHTLASTIPTWVTKRRAKWSTGKMHFSLVWNGLVTADLNTLWDFYVARKGIHNYFAFNSPIDNVGYMVRFANESMSRTKFAQAIFETGLELIEID